MAKDPRPHLDIQKSLETDGPDQDADGTHLLCPVCGFDYTHFESPYLKDGGDNYQANWGGRGDLAVLPMWSECGSKWELCVGFHKGQSSVFTRVTKSCKDQPPT